MRYPGGKRKLGNFLKAILKRNDLVGCCYTEPFAGGAGLALQLLFEGYASSVLLNDINASVFSFWYSVLNDTECLCKLIMDTPVTMAQWRHEKEIQKNAQELCGSLELGFSTFFLNRTNRSGIIKGGVIGGKEQSGEWKLDARFQRKSLIERIQNIAYRKNNIFLSRMDAVEFLKTYNKKQEYLRHFIYMDPPYYKKGSRLYDNFYQPEDHSTLSEHIKNIEDPWIVSYDDIEDVRSLYSEYQIATYSLNYTAQRKTTGLEFMAFSSNISISDIIDNTRTSYGSMRNIVAI